MQGLPSHQRIVADINAAIDEEAKVGIGCIEACSSHACLRASLCSMHGMEHSLCMIRTWRMLDRLLPPAQVRDSASEELRRARMRCRTLEGRLRSVLKGHAGEVAEQARAGMLFFYSLPLHRAPAACIPSLSDVLPDRSTAGQVSLRCKSAGKAGKTGCCCMRAGRPAVRGGGGGGRAGARRGAGRGDRGDPVPRAAGRRAAEQRAGGHARRGVCSCRERALAPNGARRGRRGRRAARARSGAASACCHLCQLPVQAVHSSSPWKLLLQLRITLVPWSSPWNLLTAPDSWYWCSRAECL